MPGLIFPTSTRTFNAPSGRICGLNREPLNLFTFFLRHFVCVLEASQNAFSAIHQDGLTVLTHESREFIAQRIVEKVGIWF
jgi:hypothetical protein